MMGKAKKFKELRKAVGVKLDKEVKYNVTKVHDAVFLNKEGEEKARIPICTMVCSGARATYRGLKKG
jgi:hypothetical protein